MGENIGRKISTLKSMVKYNGGKYFNLTLKQWREYTKHVFDDTMLPEKTEKWSATDPKKEFLDNMKSIIQHNKDGTLKTRTMKGKIDIKEGKINTIGTKTEYYFGELVDEKVPEDAKGGKIGRKIRALNNNVKYNGRKYLNFTLNQWREYT